MDHLVQFSVDLIKPSSEQGKSLSPKVSYYVMVDPDRHLCSTFHNMTIKCDSLQSDGKNNWFIRLQGDIDVTYD